MNQQLINSLLIAANVLVWLFVILTLVVVILFIIAMISGFIISRKEAKEKRKIEDAKLEAFKKSPEYVRMQKFLTTIKRDV